MSAVSASHVSCSCIGCADSSRMRPEARVSCRRPARPPCFPTRHVRRADTYYYRLVPGMQPLLYWRRFDVSVLKKEVFFVAFRVTWRPLAVMLLIGVVAGIINVLFFIFAMEPLTGAGKEDEVAVSTYVINLFVGWVFFSAWFLARADDELKKVEEAIHRGDKESFLVEAPKVIALSIRILYLLICALVVLSFHLFNLQNTLITAEIQFG